MQDFSILHAISDNFVVLQISFSICVVIVALSGLIPGLRGREGDLQAKQVAHQRPTPRIGGIAIFAGLCVSLYFSSETIRLAYQEFVAAAALLFFVGLSEDLGFRVSPVKRLLAAFGASLLVVILLGVWLPRADIPLLDSLLHYWFVGVPLTLLVTAGVANGFNLIDGVNGLAALTGITAAVALGAIAAAGGYTEMTVLAPMLVAAILGFVLLNYPFGLIFLGDAGAYTLGFVLSWFGIAVLLNVPDASAWAILLAMFWPVADTALAIYRRSMRGADAMRPDRLHMHQLVMRGLEVCCLGPERRMLANALTTVVLAPFVIAPAVVSVMVWDRPIIAALSVMAFTVLFVAFYLAGFWCARRFRRRSLGTGVSDDSPRSAQEVATTIRHAAE